MRCKACNKPLQDYEMMSKNPKSGEHEENCRTCINASFDYGTGPLVGFMDTPLLDNCPLGPGAYDD